MIGSIVVASRLVASVAPALSATVSSGRWLSWPSVR